MTARFFSMVIPAHNEATVIDRTLRALVELNYPKDRYQVIVVENGSTDSTLERARAYSADNCTVYRIEGRGVSRARNFGLSKISPETDWSICLDADISLGAEFLNELSRYLDRHPRASYGMATLTSDVSTLTSRFWFWYRTTNVRLLKSMDSIHIVRADLLASTRYPEDFEYTEDLQYAESLRGTGEYFCLPTREVVVSARRFEEVGYGRMFLRNLRIGILYVFNKQALRKKEWEVIR